MLSTNQGSPPVAPGSVRGCEVKSEEGWDEPSHICTNKLSLDCLRPAASPVGVRFDVRLALLIYYY